jgi:alkanesulfonate monooxygenase SsuD/methylene tetrahydromethanopterin reductase-like flavin-dependent oxidoreductase (luciferase family)
MPAARKATGVWVELGSVILKARRAIQDPAKRVYQSDNGQIRVHRLLHHGQPAQWHFVCRCDQRSLGPWLGASAQRGSHFAAKYGCTSLVWWEQHGDMPSAIRREKKLKAWRRAWKIALIEGRNPEWRDLYEDFLLPPNAVRNVSLDPE